MKKIRIDLDDDESIDAAIKGIEELKKQIEDFPGYVAEREQHIAISGFAMRDRNDSDIRVRVSKQPKKGYIIAEGESVGFAEYGTGVVADMDSEAPIPTGVGSWSTSEDGKGIFAKHGHWHYNGEDYIGTPPTRAMRDTVQDIKQNVGKLSKEFFK